MAVRGHEYVARLGRLVDRAPLVVALASDVDVPERGGAGREASRDSAAASGSQREHVQQEQEIRVVVKIRPNLLHYLVNGRLACVVRSHSEITAVDEATCTVEASPPHLLVAVADGALWLVTLPSSDQLSSHGGTLYQLWLQQFPDVLGLSSTAPSAGLSSLSAGITPTQFSGVLASQAGGSRVKLARQVSGAIGLEFLSLPTTSVAVVRSVIAPTTVLFSARTADAAVAAGSALGDEDAESLDHSIEIDELEGEQSTCSWSAYGSDERYAGLLARLLSTQSVPVQDTLLVLQGDADGCVRFATLALPSGAQRSTAMQVESTGTMLESIGESVVAIIPFIAATKGELPGSQDALLVCGVRGRLAILSPDMFEASASQPLQPKSRRVQTFQLCQGCAIHSLIIVQRLSVFVFCCQGTAYVCSCDALMALVREKHEVASAETVSLERIVQKLALPMGIVQIAVDSTEDSVAILFASGRIASMDMSAFSAVVVSTIPASQPVAVPPADNNAVGSDEGRVRSLLGKIAHISDQSTGERAHSLALDTQLEALSSALQVQQLVQTQGVEAVISFSVRARVTTCGSFADHTTVALTCSVRFGRHSSAIQSFDNWMIRVHVHLRCEEGNATAYTFPLQDPTASNFGGDTTLVLDPEATPVADNSVLVVRCELLFCPHTSSLPDLRGHGESRDEAPFAFSIPLGAPQQLLLIQLGQPVNESTPVNPGTLGKRSSEASRYASRYAASDEKSSGHSAVPWWSMLASHAEDDESFAGIWSKVVRVASEQNQDASRTSLTKLTSPSRFSVTISATLPTGESGQRENARIEHMLRFLGQVFPTIEPTVLRSNCRVVQGGKIWLTLRTLSGNLLLLKLQYQDTTGALSLMMQSSDAGELSAMRARVLETVETRDSQAKYDPHKVNRVCARLSTALGGHIDAVVGLEALVQELMAKVANSMGDADDSMCTDEVVHAFAQLSSIEAQVLDIYWKTRRSLDKFNV